MTTIVDLAANELKECDVCGISQTLDSFSYSSKNSDGRSDTCKGCTAYERQLTYARKRNGKIVIYISCKECPSEPQCKILVNKDGEDPPCFQCHPEHADWLVVTKAFIDAKKEASRK